MHDFKSIASSNYIPNKLRHINSGRPRNGTRERHVENRIAGAKWLSHSDACRAGVLAVKRYRTLHDKDPPKHRQCVDGAELSINSYTEEDWDMLTEVFGDVGLLPE